ncbi:MAG: hypothetical protein ACI8UX_000829, partial [Psychromonas sp.]
MLRVTKDRKTKYSSIGHSCHINHWDKTKCLPKKKHKEYKKLSILIEHKKLEAKKKLYALEMEDE